MTHPRLVAQSGLLKRANSFTADGAQLIIDLILFHCIKETSYPSLYVAPWSACQSKHNLNSIMACKQYQTIVHPGTQWIHLLCFLSMFYNS